jgi:hypothetical protein
VTRGLCRQIVERPTPCAHCHTDAVPFIVAEQSSGHRQELRPLACDVWPMQHNAAFHGVCAEHREQACAYGGVSVQVSVRLSSSSSSRKSVSARRTKWQIRMLGVEQRTGFVDRDWFTGGGVHGILGRVRAVCH